MTFSTLQSQTNSSASKFEYISPVGTDEHEYDRWLASQGISKDELDDDAVTDEERNFLVGEPD